jgi:hypothetical protein
MGLVLHDFSFVILDERRILYQILYKASAEFLVFASLCQAVSVEKQETS